MAENNGAHLMEQIVVEVGRVVNFLIRLIVYSIWGVIRALLPVGILPRKSVEGKRILITGSGSGLGRLSALKFGRLGAEVVLWDINTNGNEETKRLLEKEGIKCTAYTVDLSKREQIYSTADRVRNELGSVDILFNNAGIVTGKKLFDSPDPLIQLTVDVNLNALFYTAKAFLPQMIERGDGHLITLASMAGHQGTVGLVDYCASKHGAVGFHESLRREIKFRRAPVNTTIVNPFYINTGMFDGVKKSKFDFLLPILEPEYVVDRIVEAVLTNQEQLFLPKFLYIIKALNGIVPVEIGDLLLEVSGTDHSMDEFVGRPKSQ